MNFYTCVQKCSDLFVFQLTRFAEQSGSIDSGGPNSTQYSCTRRDPACAAPHAGPASEGYGWKPSSNSNFSIRAFRACPLIEIRQTVPCRAIRGNSISVNGTLPPSYVCRTSCIASDARVRPVSCLKCMCVCVYIYIYTHLSLSLYISLSLYMSPY